MKVENSGLPNDNMTEESIAHYIQGYIGREGIYLNRNNILLNPGKKAIAKRSANSHMGKHGQSALQRKTELIRDEQIFFDLLTNSRIRVVGAYTLSVPVLCVQYENRDEYVVNKARSNVVLAAYTTSLARIFLYTILRQLNRRVLYFDTDSVMFTAKQGEFMPLIREYLGYLTDEISENYGTEYYINRFLAGRPKNYVLEPKHKNENIVNICARLKK